MTSTDTPPADGVTFPRWSRPTCRARPSTSDSDSVPTIKPYNSSKVRFTLEDTVHLVARLPFDALRGDVRNPAGGDPDYLSIGQARNFRLCRFAETYIGVKALRAWCRHCAGKPSSRRGGRRRRVGAGLMIEDEPCWWSMSLDVDGAFDDTALDGWGADRTDSCEDGAFDGTVGETATCAGPEAAACVDLCADEAFDQSIDQKLDACGDDLFWLSSIELGVTDAGVSDGRRRRLEASCAADLASCWPTTSSMHTYSGDLEFSWAPGEGSHDFFEGSTAAQDCAKAWPDASDDERSAQTTPVLEMGLETIAEGAEIALLPRSASCPAPLGELVAL